MADGDRETRKSQLLKGLAELALLALLDESPAYGLEILEGLRERAGLPVAEGSIYPLLHRLERAGLVGSQWQLDAGGARPRRYYTLTDAGSRELAELRAEWLALSETFTSFLRTRG